MSGSPALRLPRAVPAGSTIGVCAPAGPVVDEEALECGLAWLAGEGYGVRCGDHLRGRRGFLAGTDEERLADLRALLADPDVRAILVARGGYGLPRILTALDPRAVRRARKCFVGYSDATALLLWLRRRAGLAGIHGPMLERRDVTAAARARLVALLRGEPGGVAPLRGRRLRPGRARGPLVGGSLSLVAASLGTPWEIQTRGAILFLEEVDEPPYAVDRMLVQLREAGKLAPVAGVAIGQLVRCESERYPETGVRDVIAETLLPSVPGPVVEELPFGHVPENLALGFGVEAELDGETGTLLAGAPVAGEAE